MVLSKNNEKKLIPQIWIRSIFQHQDFSALLPITLTRIYWSEIARGE